MRNRCRCWAQLPTSSCGEYAASVGVAERVSDVLLIAVVHHRSLMIEVTPIL